MLSSKESKCLRDVLLGVVAAGVCHVTLSPTWELAAIVTCRVHRSAKRSAKMASSLFPHP